MTEDVERVQALLEWIGGNACHAVVAHRAGFERWCRALHGAVAAGVGTLVSADDNQVTVQTPDGTGTLRMSYTGLLEVP